MWTELNTGQDMSTGVLPALRLPGEPRVPGSISLSDLSLNHDKNTDTLYLSDSEGPVGLAYLGLTPQHLLSGYFRWLTLLADPWIKITPYSDHWTSHLGELKSLLIGEVVTKPRIQHGRLVTRRASWYLPRTVFADLFAGDRVDILRAWHQIRIKFGIPKEVFIHQLVPPHGYTVYLHKPLYVDLTSAVSLMVFQKWLKTNTSHIRVVEALPATNTHPWRDENHLPRAREEYVSFYWKGGS